MILFNDELLSKHSAEEVYGLATNYYSDSKGASDFILKHFNLRVKAGCSSKELREIVAMNCRVLDYFKNLETTQTTKGA